MNSLKKGFIILAGISAICSNALSQTSNFIPESYSLYRNFPNPFNPSTNIKYNISKSGFVSLKIFDVTGKEVAVLVNKEQISGNYKFVFNNTNFPSSVYFYKLTAGDFSKTRRMLLIK